MRTPAGFECRYFYGNYFRGHSQEECRLIGNQPPPHNWSPDICKNCPVPRIVLANACPNMVLKGEVHKTFMGFKKTVKVTAYCKKSQTFVEEPEIGCGQCHPLPIAFTDEEK